MLEAWIIDHFQKEGRARKDARTPLHKEAPPQHQETTPDVVENEPRGSTEIDFSL